MNCQRELVVKEVEDECESISEEDILHLRSAPIKAFKDTANDECLCGYST